MKQLHSWVHGFTMMICISSASKTQTLKTQRIINKWSPLYCTQDSRVLIQFHSRATCKEAAFHTTPHVAPFHNRCSKSSFTHSSLHTILNSLTNTITIKLSHTVKNTTSSFIFHFTWLVQLSDAKSKPCLTHPPPSAFFGDSFFVNLRKLTNFVTILVFFP